MSLISWGKKIILAVLWWQTMAIIRRYRPKLVGITGSVGKTSTKDAVVAVLQTVHQVRGSAKSYNSELGLPLTVIGAASAWRRLWGWLVIIARGGRLLWRRVDYPTWLILEVGADRPGDIKSVVKRLSFDVGVLTFLPDLPVHMEFFPSVETVIEEKWSLLKSLPSTGLAVLNADDPNQWRRRADIGCHLITYGQRSDAQVRAVSPHLLYESDPAGRRRPAGLTFKLEYEGASLPVRLPGVIGRHQLYPVLAAAAVGLKFGVNLVQISEALNNLVFPPGRLRLLPGMKGSLILDDTYNSSPAALTAALAALGEIETVGRKIAVIGDMLELGDKTIEAHKAAGRQAAAVADWLITVGVRAKFVLEGAKEKKFPVRRMKSFSTAEAAGEYLERQLKTDDTVLLKGSQRMRLERAVEKIMAEPDKKELLLCRQEPEWLKL